MTTDTSEKGLETLIMRHMTGTDGLTVTPNKVTERPPPYGSAQDYNRAHALDVPQLFASLRATQAEALHAQNRFSVTRQLAYSMDETRRVLDLGLFINGLPDVVTGKLDVREAVARLPEEAAPDTIEDDTDPSLDPAAADEEAIA